MCSFENIIRKSDVSSADFDVVQIEIVHLISIKYKSADPKSVLSTIINRNISKKG